MNTPNTMKCHYPYEQYAAPPSSYEKLLRITLRGTQYDHLEPDHPGIYEFSEVYQYDTAGVLRYASRAWKKGAEECWYNEQGLIIRENKSQGYCDHLSHSTHLSYFYRATDNSLLRKVVYERFSYPQDSQDQAAFCMDDCKEYAYELYAPKVSDETIPLEFWYLDRKSAKDIYDHDSYYLYTHFDWDPMTIEFDNFATVDIIDHGLKHRSDIHFNSASSSAPLFFDLELGHPQAMFLPTPQQSKVMIPHCILGHPVNDKITLYPQNIEHLYIPSGFAEIELCDFCDLQSIYLPESLQTLTAWDEAKDVKFVVHKDSHAHRICEQLGYDYVLAPKDNLGFSEYFQWADGKLKW